MKIYFFLFFFLFMLCSPSGNGQGLKGEYFRGRTFGAKVLTRTDPTINFNWEKNSPAPGMPMTDYSIRWTGRLHAPATGEYFFSAIVDDGMRLWVGGVKVIDAWGPHDHESVSGNVSMKAGQTYDLKVEYYNGILEGQIQLMWEIPTPKKSLFERVVGKMTFIDRHHLSPPPPPVATPVVEAKPIVADIQAPEPPEAPEEKPQPKKKEVPAPPKETLPEPPPPAPKVVRTSVQGRMKDTIDKYTPKNVLFAQAEPFVLDESLPELDKLVKLLNRFEKLTVTIEGHTDVTGDPASNFQLSKDRANEVAFYLKEKGIDAKRITTKGFGASRPIVSKDSTQLYPQNRRVEFKIQ